MKSFSIVISIAAAILVVGCQRESVFNGAFPDAVHSSQSQDSLATEDNTAILAGGCFWCVEADFEKLLGVLDVVSGYSGGSANNPTYENYANSGHVEVVKVTYDPSQVTYAGLVEWLIKHSDPTDSNGSFGDRGSQYRPVVYYAGQQEKRAAEEVIATVNKLQIYKEKLAIEVAQRMKFWPAESYHQDYAEKSWVKYDYYRYASGRDAFIKKHWDERAQKLELVGSIPEKTIDSGKAFATAPNDELADNTVADTVELSWKDFHKPSKQELKQKLTDIQYEVTQQNGTEPSFQNTYWDNKESGLYVDVVSGEPLFSSTDKFKSGTGWPSFVRPLDMQFITLKEDNTLFSSRTEVRSKIADSHIGHVFNDGPADRGGKRWCMNSAALRFVPKEKMDVEGYGEYVPFVEPFKP